ncbi:V-set and transmembrane domain-containing protein 2-like protein isoform X1 [Lethenteron reissneri]|uniref:V-set and transmembrane domain-containing protein 2-like protein isoform X1 n=2 Tax=Lethenteron reissneri TaxID=7753 RepID=UPI002AB609C8|nr:V-set and transmembrane domain-containing protein 2-like protein isoform X1 [Lethenteron reissneri]
MLGTGCSASVTVVVAAAAILAVAKGRFVQIPGDMRAREGQDVDLTCSYRGGGAPAFAPLEIQWWFLGSVPVSESTQQQQEEEEEDVHELQGGFSQEPTKISVVRVLGSSISSRLHLTNVRKQDEGTYECRVTDRHAWPAQEHKARAALTVEMAGGRRRPGGPRDVQAAEAMPLFHNVTAKRSPARPAGAQGGASTPNANVGRTSGGPRTCPRQHILLVKAALILAAQYFVIHAK